MARPEKLSKEAVLKKLKDAVKKNKIVLSIHADQRMQERNISWFEILDVLKNGHNERRKDQFKDEFNSWVYSIRHDVAESSERKRKLRIPVSFDKDGTIVISAIDLDQSETI